MFNRYGRVQSIKLFASGKALYEKGIFYGNAESEIDARKSCSSNMACATISFMDIKSAAKAHAAVHVIDKKTLTTNYFEPQRIENRSSTSNEYVFSNKYFFLEKKFVFLESLYFFFKNVKK